MTLVFLPMGTKCMDPLPFSLTFTLKGYPPAGPSHPQRRRGLQTAVDGASRQVVRGQAPALPQPFHRLGLHHAAQVGHAEGEVGFVPEHVLVAHLPGREGGPGEAAGDFQVRLEEGEFENAPAPHLRDEDAQHIQILRKEMGMSWWCPSCPCHPCDGPGRAR